MGISGSHPTGDLTSDPGCGQANGACILALSATSLARRWAAFSFLFLFEELLPAFVTASLASHSSGIGRCWPANIGASVPIVARANMSGSGRPWSTVLAWVSTGTSARTRCSCTCELWCRPFAHPWPRPFSVARLCAWLLAFWTSLASHRLIFLSTFV